MEEKKPINIFEFWDSKVAPLFKYLKKFWYAPLIFGAFIFGVVYFQESAKKPQFSSRITFMLEDDILGDNKQGGAGSQLLMALGNQNTGSNKAVLVDLSLSNKLVEETLIKKVKIEKDSVILVNYYMDKMGYLKQWKKEKNPTLSNFSFKDNYTIGSDKERDYWLRLFSNEIKLALRSQVLESSLIVMNYSSSDEMFAKVFLESHLETISEFYIRKKVERASNLVQFARRKKDSLLSALTGKTYGLATVQDQGFGQVMKRAKVPEIQMTRDLGILNQQYNESVAALSAASIDMERQKPFISVVDDIRLPLEGVWPKPLNKSITFSIISIILGYASIIGLVLGLNFIREQRGAFKSQTKK